MNKHIRKGQCKTNNSFTFKFYILYDCSFTDLEVNRLFDAKAQTLQFRDCSHPVEKIYRAAEEREIHLKSAHFNEEMDILFELLRENIFELYDIIL